MRVTDRGRRRRGVCEPSDPRPDGRRCGRATRAKHDVHALPSQISSLVESLSLLCATGADEHWPPPRAAIPVAARRRAGARGAIARPSARTGTVHPDRDPHREALRRAGLHLDQRCPGFSGGGSGARSGRSGRVERSPPETCKQESRTQDHRTSCPEPDRADGQDAGPKRQSNSWGADGK